MVNQHARELSVAAAIAVICIVLAFAAPTFFTLENLGDLVLANMPVLIVAIGMTVVILTGQIDISVGSQFAICGVLAGVFAKWGLPTIAVGFLACAAGALLGALNGALVAYVRIPSIVVTLATMVVLRDALRWITEGAWVQGLPSAFQWFGLSQSASTLVTLCIAFTLVLVSAWILENVAAGRAVYATGSDADAARLAGINSARVVLFAFVLAGALTGCAALLNSVRFDQIPSNAGIGLEMKVIAAVVVGGTTVTGGKGTITGTLLGVVLLGVIGPALTFLGVSPYWERAIEGGIILAAVAIDALGMRSLQGGGALGRQRA
jgi:rhamnose transport system permease protein